MSKILILDIETTGFLQQNGKIVEIGIVELDLENGQREIIFNEVCHEKGITLEEISNAWIISNSDLNINLIKYSGTLESKKGRIQNILNSYPLGATAFNNAFDFGFLEDRGFVFPKKLPCYPNQCALYGDTQIQSSFYPFLAILSNNQIKTLYFLELFLM